MASASGGARQTGRQLTADHEGFLRHRRFRWLKLAAGLCLLAFLAYALADVQPRPNGGSWLGYTLGTIGALLIVWLAMLGLRKRIMTRGGWSLKSWTSAHVYLGLALIVIGTLHSGFQFGWNVHTLAWALMVLTIVSGAYGAAAYAVLPAQLSANREQMTESQMIAGLVAVDRQLDEAAQMLDRGRTGPVVAALAENPMADGLWRRLVARRRPGPTHRAVDAFKRAGDGAASDPHAVKVEALLQRRLAQLDRIRRHAQIKAQLELWLYVHVPATFALIAALAAHVVSVFYYW